MHQVTGKYPDYQKTSLNSNFYLNADQSFNPFTWKQPIHWEGIVGGQKVQFVQIDSSGSSKHDYDWTDFPEQVASAIPYIVEAIDSAMKVMD